MDLIIGRLILVDRPDSMNEMVWPNGDARRRSNLLMLLVEVVSTGVYPEDKGVSAVAEAIFAVCLPAVEPGGGVGETPPLIARVYASGPGPHRAGIWFARAACTYIFGRIHLTAAQSNGQC